MVQRSTAQHHDRRGAHASRHAQPLPPRPERNAAPGARRRTAHHRLHFLAVEGTPDAGVVMGASRTAEGRSPAPALLLGLAVTLLAVVAVSWYTTRQISSLRELQTDLGDRNRADSLQLLRIQNDLNSLGLAMRDMLDNDEPYPLTAWSAQFARIRLDLSDALAREESVAVAARTPEQRQYLTASVSQ